MQRLRWQRGQRVRGVLSRQAPRVGPGPRHAGAAPARLLPGWAGVLPRWPGLAVVVRRGLRGGTRPLAWTGPLPPRTAARAAARIPLGGIAAGKPCSVAVGP